MNKIIFIKNQVKNVHDSQKWMWSLLAGFAMFKAIKELGEPNSDNFLFTFAFYLIFLLIVFRFYVGDNRILDYYYDSVPRAIEDDNKFWIYIETLNPKTIALDSIIRVVQYIVIVAAATNLNETTKFIYNIALLFLINSLYSFIIPKIISTKSDLIIKEYMDPTISFEKYRKIWKWNNFLSLISICLILYFYNSHECFLSIFIILFINSVIDLYFCKDVYFPNYIDFK